MGRNKWLSFLAAMSDRMPIHAQDHPISHSRRSASRVSRPPLEANAVRRDELTYLESPISYSRQSASRVFCSLLGTNAVREDARHTLLNHVTPFSCIEPHSSIQCSDPLNTTYKDLCNHRKRFRGLMAKHRECETLPKMSVQAMAYPKEHMARSGIWQ